MKYLYIVKFIMKTDTWHVEKQGYEYVERGYSHNEIWNMIRGYEVTYMKHTNIVKYKKHLIKTTILSISFGYPDIMYYISW